jgi:hypothetical protein
MPVILFWSQSPNFLGNPIRFARLIKNSDRQIHHHRNGLKRCLSLVEMTIHPSEGLLKRSKCYALLQDGLIRMLSVVRSDKFKIVVKGWSLLNVIWMLPESQSSECWDGSLIVRNTNHPGELSRKSCVNIRFWLLKSNFLRAWNRLSNP